ncbi:MAG: YciI family protein [Caldilineaceae bacterium]
MTYLFLAYEDDHEKMTMTSSEHERLKEACLANDEALRQRGHLLLSKDLHDDSPTVILQLDRAELSLLEGSLCQKKSPISELFIINARDLNEAIRLASQMPQLKLGAIEVRTITHFDW